VKKKRCAVELKSQLWFSQLWVWLAIGAITLAVSLLLFSMASTGAIERNSLLGQIGRLAHLRAESDRRRHRISHANLQVCAMNERSLRSVGTELHHGLGQHLALALLKFEALDLLVADASVAMPSRSATHPKDLAEIRKALNDTLRRIRHVASGFPPADIERLSLEETLAGAAKHHENRTGIPVEFRSCGLPEQLSFALKASFYRFMTECLDSTYPAHAQSVSVSCDQKTMTLEIVGGQGTLNADNAGDVGGTRPAFGNLRDRMEAIGGRLRLAPAPGGEFSVIAEFSFAEMEAAGG
jgi:signal transduction histidine kinase